MNNITGEEMLEEMSKLNPSDLKEETRDLFNTIMRVIDEKEELYEENKEYSRNLKIKDAYLQLIIDLAWNYDGFNDIDGLKGLIEELSGYAKMALKNDDKTPFYIGSNEENFNILDEIIKDND